LQNIFRRASLELAHFGTSIPICFSPDSRITDYPGSFLPC
jgi:hypothetical protein